MSRVRTLPIAPQYRDLPVWQDNRDTVEKRVANATWDALLDLDPAEISLKAIAEEVGVSLPALYHHYPSRGALMFEMARLSFDKLYDVINELLREDVDGRDFVPGLCRKYVGFARARPNHFALMFRPRFRTRPNVDVSERWQLLGVFIGDFLRKQLERDPTPAEVHQFWSLIHGAAALAAMGLPVDQAELERNAIRYVDERRATSPVKSGEHSG